MWCLKSLTSNTNFLKYKFDAKVSNGLFLVCNAVFNELFEKRVELNSMNPNAIFYTHITLLKYESSCLCSKKAGMWDYGGELLALFLSSVFGE